MIFLLDEVLHRIYSDILRDRSGDASGGFPEKVLPASWIRPGPVRGFRVPLPRAGGGWKR